MKTFGWSKQDPETFEPLELERDVKFGKPLHLGDVFNLVDAFDATGHYKKGRQGKPPLTEGSLFKAIKDFQTDEGLEPDAWMTPGGPTLQRLNEVLPQKLEKPWRGAKVKAPLHEPAGELSAPAAERRPLPDDIGDWTFADLARHRRSQGLPPGIGPAYRFSENLARTPQPARVTTTTRSERRAMPIPTLQAELLQSRVQAPAPAPVGPPLAAPQPTPALPPRLPVFPLPRPAQSVQRQPLILNDRPIDALGRPIEERPGEPCPLPPGTAARIEVRFARVIDVAGRQIGGHAYFLITNVGGAQYTLDAPPRQDRATSEDRNVITGPLQPYVDEWGPRSFDHDNEWGRGRSSRDGRGYAQVLARGEDAARAVARLFDYACLTARAARGYDMFPQPYGPGYNSNSWVQGAAEYAGLARVQPHPHIPPGHLPGLGKPLRVSEERLIQDPYPDDPHRNPDNWRPQQRYLPNGDPVPSPTS